jgi:UPF0755 protein
MEFACFIKIKLLTASVKWSIWIVGNRYLEVIYFVSMKRFVFPLTVILVFVVFSLFTVLWWSRNTKPVSLEETKVRFVIPKGSNASEIGSSLQDVSLIRSSLAFKLYVQVTSKSKKLMPGQFTLSSNMSLGEVVEKLLQGPDEFWVTVPEGLRREEVVDIYINTLEMSTSQTEIFRRDFLKETEQLEGYLFPDTYLFPVDVDASVVVSRMKSVFDQRVDEGIKTQISQGKLTLNQVVTLASIIERETITDEERPIVSGILLNRLEADGWLLQADAAVQYGVANIRCRESNLECDDWWPILSRKDLEIDSPYNTYKFDGLPPGPIASPGLSSIKSVVDFQTSDYWFYLHDSEGDIHYAKTLEEHNRNVSTYLGK